MSNQDSNEINHQYYETNENNWFSNQNNDQMNYERNKEIQEQMNQQMYEDYVNQINNSNEDSNKTRMEQEEIQNSNNENIDDRTTIKQFPRQVMTALGPLPLPEEFINNIPEKFVAKPIIEEREIYVSKKERKQREVEVPHVQYEHTFKNIRKQFQVSKLIPTVSEVIKEVPKEILKPVIEEKIIEVPQGVKYVEVPVEVPCLYPPKIVPKVVTQYVERIVETVKPIVQEKIIEVPQTVIKQIPKIKTVEVPYFVPRYVEKIVEVPFRPNGDMLRIGTNVPFNISKTLPPLKPTHMMNENHRDAKDMNQTTNFQHEEYAHMNDMNLHDMGNTMPSINLDANPKINNMSRQNSYLRPVQYGNSFQPMNNSQMNSNFNPNMFMNSNNTNRENLVSQVENVSNRVNLPEGMQWGYPEGINKPILSNNQVPPLVITCPPEIGRVTCARKDIQPDILTKGGVFEFEGFKKKGTSQALFPPLAPHNRVPFLPPPAAPGTPDVRTFERH